MRAYCSYTKPIDFLVFSGFFLKPKASGVSLGSRGQGYELNIFENGRKGSLFGGARSPLPLVPRQRFTGYVRAYCFYTKPIDFLVFYGFFSKPKASGVSLGSRGESYELKIFENRRKGGHFGGARNRLPLLLGNVLQPICGPSLFIRNPSIFSFSLGFSQSQRHLELVLDKGDKVMSLIYLKMGEKAVISKERVACYLYH